MLSIVLGVCRFLARLVLALVLAAADFAWLRLRRRRNVSDAPVKRVAVIGGGIAGCGAAHALRASGVEVDVYERAASVGGNAKTCTWPDGKTTGLSVLAWPRAYFRNYRALLASLGVETAPVRLPFWLSRADGEWFAHGAAGAPLAKRYARDFERWATMLAHVRAINGFCCGADPAQPSLYHMSLLNPLNLVPLRLLSRAYGVSAGFWADVFLPLHATSFLTAELDALPAVILPIIMDMIPADPSATPAMESWAGCSAQVFDAVGKGCRVFTSCEVTGVSQSDDGRWAVQVAGYPCVNAGYDRLIFAASAHAAAAALPRATRAEAWAWAAHRALLGGVVYCDGPAFRTGIIHSDASILPEEHREALCNKYANFIVAHPTRAGETPRFENTFILSSWVPAVQPPPAAGAAAGPPTPRLVTYDARRPEQLASRVGAVENVENHPHLSPSTLAVAMLLRFLQGRRGVYFCGSYATPGNGHDPSLCSGLAAAVAIGAAYPFEHDAEARADFDRLRALMGL